MFINPLSNKKVRNAAIAGVVVIATIGIAYAAKPKSKPKRKALKK
jgi:hypothetical protein